MFALVLMVGLVLRTLMLTGERSFWGDEWFSLQLVQGDLRSVFFGALADVHPPGYFLLLHAVHRLLGNGEWVYRLPSFAAGLGVLFALYFLARDIFGKTVGLTASFFAAVSPYWLQSSNEVRSYSLHAFVTLLGSGFFLRAVEDPANKRWAFFYAAAAVTAVYTEHYAWFWLFAATLTMLMLRIIHALPALLGRVQIFVLAGSLPSLVLIAYQAVFHEHALRLSRLSAYLDPAVLAKKVAGIFWHFSCGYTFSMLTVDKIVSGARSSLFFWLCAALTLGMTALALLGARALWKEKKHTGLFFAAVLFFPVIFLAVFYPIRLDARYLSFAAPYFFILAAAGIWTIRAPWVKALFAGFFLAVSLTASAFAISLPTDVIHREDHRALVTYALTHARPGDALCGLKQQVEYYRGGLGAPAVHAYGEMREVPPEELVALHRVWLLRIINMHDEDNAQYDGERREEMRAIGFEPAGPPMRFGGENGLTALYLFERKEHGG